MKTKPRCRTRRRTLYRKRNSIIMMSGDISIFSPPPGIEETLPFIVIRANKGPL